MGYFHNAKRAVIGNLIRRKCTQIAAVSAERTWRESKNSAVSAFHHALKTSPAYAELIGNAGARAAAVKNFDDFTAIVPIIDKATLFEHFDPAALFPDIHTEPAGRLWSSSGSSGAFTFGFEAPKRLAHTARSVDFMLEYVYGILSRKTLFINCLPNPWPVPSNYMHHAAIGTRTDVAIAFLKKMTNVYEQFILGGEPLFLKKLLEDALVAGVNLKKLNIHLLLGGEYVAENLRQYFLHLLRDETAASTRKQSDSALLTLGLAEFGVGVLYELPPLAAVRERLSSSPSLFIDRPGDNEPYCPQILQCNPYATFVETPILSDGNRHLVLTDLNPNAAFPFIRYDTGDLGTLISHQDFIAFAKTSTPDIDLSGLFPFPIIFTVGRKSGVRVGENNILEINEAKELLFAFHGLIPHITGCFHLRENAEEAAPAMSIQLKPTVHEDMLPDTERNALVNLLRERGVAPLFVPYHQFPISMELSFDKKFAYV